MCTGAVYTLLALREKWLTEKQQRILPLRSNVSILDVNQTYICRGIDKAQTKQINFPIESGPLNAVFGLQTLIEIKLSNCANGKKFFSFNFKMEETSCSKLALRLRSDEKKFQKTFIFSLWGKHTAIFIPLFFQYCSIALAFYDIDNWPKLVHLFLKKF